jgi:Contractile injection system tube protein/LysM domain
MALEKATILRKDTGELLVTALFNPEEYAVNRDNNFAQIAIPGGRAPLIQFVHGNAQTLEMELLLDTIEQHTANGRRTNQAGDDVRPLVQRLTRLLDIDPATHAPPVLEFVWASFAFTCVLSRANQKYTMFRADGAPVRAKVTVAFTEFTNAELEAKQIKRETADYTKVHAVAQGDTLPSIARRLLGSPAHWRPIAIANQIENPRELRIGQQLIIPRLPFRDPDTGEVHEA